MFAARATHRDDGQGGSWTDTEGYEESSQLARPDDPTLVFERDDIAHVFLAALD